MPVRFDQPRVGGSTRPQLRAGEWQIDVAYRRLAADEWFVGTKVNEAAAPFGHTLYVNVNSITVTTNYGLTDRLTSSISFPFSFGTHSRYYADAHRHEVSASGFGDLSAVMTYWLRNPNQPSKGNISLGVGVKSLSGDNAVSRDFYLKDGSAIQSPVDQSIQLGDGGWGILFQAQAYRGISSSIVGYAQGWYLLTPKDTTNIISPYPTVPLSVPDVYAARVGSAFNFKPLRGVGFNLGVRIDGIPIRDLVGGSDGFRRPGYSFYFDPGVTYSHGRHAFTINTPVMVYEDFKRSRVDVQLNRPGGGDLARYLIIAQYSVRFGGKSRLPKLRDTAPSRPSGQ
jgi:hypothetical protein